MTCSAQRHHSEGARVSALESVRECTCAWRARRACAQAASDGAHDLEVGVRLAGDVRIGQTTRPQDAHM